MEEEEDVMRNRSRRRRRWGRRGERVPTGPFGDGVAHFF